jgi:DegV family protein with EDD domain
MRTGVVVDPSCDLPRSFIDEHGIIVLPGLLEFGDKELMDVRDAHETLAMYRRYIADRSLESRSRALGIDRIRDIFLDELVLKYDRIVVLCVSATRGRVFSHATQASYAILQGYRQRREAAGIDESFALRVLDTGSVGPGQGVLAHEAVRLIETESPPFEKLRRTIKDMTRRVVCMLVPNDLYYLRFRASSKGEQSLGGTAYHLGNILGVKPILRMQQGASQVAGYVRGFERGVSRVLENAREAMSRGHVGSVVAMSFGGDPRVIRDLTAYQEFETYAAMQRCELHLSVMSATLAVNVGPGAFALAYIAS